MDKKQYSNTVGGNQQAYQEPKSSRPYPPKMEIMQPPSMVNFEEGSSGRSYEQHVRSTGFSYYPPIASKVVAFPSSNPVHCPPNPPSLFPSTSNAPSNLKTLPRKRMHYEKAGDLPYMIDVVDYTDDYRIYADLPSVVPESIHIYVQKEGIRVEGVRSLNYDGCVKVLLRRRPTGSFIMLLPCDHSQVDVEHATASYNAGELAIFLKKRNVSNSPADMGESVQVVPLSSNKRRRV